MMLLFRSSFITAIAFIFVLSVTVSAVPQFGRPMFHALDVDSDKPVPHDNSTAAVSAEPAVASVAASQSAEIVGAPAAPAAASGNYAGKATNGARPSRHTNRRKMGISLGIAATFVYSVL